MRLIDFALDYARSGLAVIPLYWPTDTGCSCGQPDCDSIGKHPRTVHGKDEATTDPDTIRAWWTRWPAANIGLRPPSGIVVLDVDPRNGGHRELARLMAEHGPLPTTLTALTGGGGLHIWLAYHGPKRGKLAPGIDVKTHTGYVVAPPSVHASGRHYTWAITAPTAPTPGWVRRLFTPPPAPRLVRFRSAQSGNGTTKLDDLVRFVAASREGERNNRLYWAAIRAHESNLDTEPLVDAATSIGLPEQAVRDTVESAATPPPRRTGAGR